MRNRFFFLLFFVSISSIVSSQKAHLKGKITNSFDVEGIHVLNQTSKLNTVTNANGEFVITVKMKDTLLFSSIKYRIQEIIITEEIFRQGILVIALEELINKLDEVLLGNTLTGNLAYDIKKIKTEKEINFDDVGIPGFKGVPQERIIHPVEAFFPTNINIEAVYKHISGYYKKLKVKRKWTSENTLVAEIIDYYGYSFFEEAYGLPQNRVYEFMLFCVETTSIQFDFKKQNFAGVLNVFKIKSEVYLSRISTNN